MRRRRFLLLLILFPLALFPWLLTTTRDEPTESLTIIPPCHPNLGLPGRWKVINRFQAIFTPSHCHLRDFDNPITLASCINSYSSRWLMLIGDSNMRSVFQDLSSKLLQVEGATHVRSTVGAGQWDDRDLVVRWQGADLRLSLRFLTGINFNHTTVQARWHTILHNSTWAFSTHPKEEGDDPFPRHSHEHIAWEGKPDALVVYLGHWTMGPHLQKDLAHRWIPTLFKHLDQADLFKKESKTRLLFMLLGQFNPEANEIRNTWRRGWTLNQVETANEAVSKEWDARTKSLSKDRWALLDTPLLLEGYGIGNATSPDGYHLSSTARKAVASVALDWICE